MKNLIYLFLALFIGANLFAQTPDEDIYKLTANDVSHFIKNYPGLETDLEKLGVKYDREDGDFTLPESMEALNDFNKVIQKHGYNNYQEFTAKAGAIVLAYASLKSDSGMLDAETELKTSMKEIDNNPNLTSEQKQMMKQQMQASLLIMQTYAGSLSTSANVKVVEQYIDELDRVFDEND